MGWVREVTKAVGVLTQELQAESGDSVVSRKFLGALFEECICRARTVGCGYISQRRCWRWAREQILLTRVGAEVALAPQFSQLTEVDRALEY